MAITRGKLLAELATQDESEEVKLQLETIYTALIACSTGDLPTPEQFLDEMTEEDIEKWIRAARKYNHRWFSWLDEVIPEEKKMT